MVAFLLPLIGAALPWVARGIAVGLGSAAVGAVVHEATKAHKKKPKRRSSKARRRRRR